MFTHKFANIPKLEQVNCPTEGRYYATLLGDVKYPSITRVLGEMSDKTSLIKWKERVGEAEAERISKVATERGTAMHQLCEDYLMNKELSDVDNVGGEMLFKIMCQVLKRFDNIRCLEAPMFSHTLRVAGTVDCIAEIDGKLTIIDFKTSMKQKRKAWIDNYFMQACFYFTAYYEMTGEMPKQIAILIACMDGTLQEFYLKPKDVKAYTVKLKDTIDQYYEKVAS